AGLAAELAIALRVVLLEDFAHARNDDRLHEGGLLLFRHAISPGGRRCSGGRGGGRCGRGRRGGGGRGGRGGGGRCGGGGRGGGRRARLGRGRGARGGGRRGLGSATAARGEGDRGGKGNGPGGGQSGSHCAGLLHLGARWPAFDEAMNRSLAGNNRE